MNVQITYLHIHSFGSFRSFPSIKKMMKALYVYSRIKNSAKLKTEKMNSRKITKK